MQLRSIVVDCGAQKISIDATGYDEIVWISGEVVQRGPVFDFSDRRSMLSYVRAELIRHTDDGPIRLFTNPFALTPKQRYAQ